MSGLYQAYAALLLAALLPIVAGAHSSVKMPKAAKRTLLASQGRDIDEEDEDEDEIDRLTATDAYLFPVLGSIVLVSLYLAFKFLDKAMVNMLLGAYFALLGTAGLARMGVAATRTVTTDAWWRSLTKWDFSFNIRRNKTDYSSFDVRILVVHAVAGIAAVGLTAAHHFAFNQHWTLSNIIALSFSYNAISLLRLDSFFTGAALLGGLFLYDIWWVFGTEVMVSVARDFNAPIKILWPKDLGAVDSGFTLLGLGDIVLPGVFIALALRFDYHLALKRTPLLTPSTSFAKPYFLSCFASYIAGLATTIFVMHTFKSAQPALLYLSPACVGSVVLCALIRGESKEFWAFNDGSEDEERQEKKVEEIEAPVKEEVVASSTPTSTRTLRSRTSRLAVE